MKITVRWQVDDGYVGGARPHRTTVNTEEMMEDEMWNQLSDDEKKEHLISYVEDDFNDRITFAIDDYGI